MSIRNHRSEISSKLDDNDDRSEGELDSSFNETDDDNDDNVEAIRKTLTQPQQTSQTWTKMLTDENLSSLMTNALADNSEIIHIDDPIAQQSTNPLTYVFPSGTNIDEYFQRKKKQDEKDKKRKPTQRDLKSLSRLLSNEKNDDLLRAIMDTIGCRRAFQYANEAIRLYNTNDESLITSENGSKRTLGGFYFKMLIKDTDNEFLKQQERDQIKKLNQSIQKTKKKKSKKKKAENKNSMEDN